MKFEILEVNYTSHKNVLRRIYSARDSQDGVKGK